MRSKYDKIHDFLVKQEGDEIELTFKQVERIVGAKLPRSARQGASFWGNDFSHSQARAWMSAAWRTRDVSVGQEHVTFVSDHKAHLLGEEHVAREVAWFLYGSRRAVTSRIREMKREIESSP